MCHLSENLSTALMTSRNLLKGNANAKYARMDHRRSTVVGKENRFQIETADFNALMAWLNHDNLRSKRSLFQRKHSLESCFYVSISKNLTFNWSEISYQKIQGSFSSTAAPLAHVKSRIVNITINEL